MNILVAPAYEALVQVIPLASVCLENLNSNKERWEELKDEFAQRMNNKKNFIPESRGIIKESYEKSSSLIHKTISGRHSNLLEGTENKLLNTGPYQANNAK